MVRNKTNPRMYVDDPKKRSKEKTNELLRWLLQFHHSTRKIILEKLKLNVHSHHTYFKKLINKGILQRVRVYSINERFVYMLTNLGKELATELYDEAIKYSTDQSKINHAELRHSLAIQNAVLIFGKESTKFLSEKFIDRNMYSDKKRPDAALIDQNHITMLEIELTPKKDERIFRAFVAHHDALKKGTYQKTLYLFSNKTLKEYYLKRFNSEEWPTFAKENNKWKNKNDPLLHSQIQHIKEKFEFIEENRIIRYM